jgi:hypothetical protein
MFYSFLITFLTEKPKSTRYMNELRICIDPSPLMGAFAASFSSEFPMVSDPAEMKKRNPKRE